MPLTATPSRCQLFPVTLLIALAAALPFYARAQDTSTVQGRVTDAATGDPLAGANVVAQGTSVGTATDAEGYYELALPAGADSLVFSFIGYDAQVVAVAGRSRLDVVLQGASRAISELVVTALNVEREKRALGYSVEKVDSEDLSRGEESHVAQALAGKVAGLSITGGSAGIASTPRITIRGESSLSGNNAPLVVVDGVPVDNSTNTTFAGAQFTQVDFGDALGQINPDDIEEISVLKGPSAAALYGSRAAGGVILITTKSGRGAGGLGVQFNSSTTAERVLRLPRYQDEYGAGAGGTYAFVNGDGTGGGNDGQGYNWGPPLDGRPITQFGSPRGEDGSLVPVPFEAQPGNVRDFFETGLSLQNNLALQGASDDGHFRLSLGRLDRTGIVPNTELRRNNVSLTAGYDATDRLRVDASVNYVKTTSDNVPTSGYGSESIMYSFLWWGRNLKTEWLEDYWMEGQEGVQQRNFDMNWTNNIYFQVNENTNSLDKDRLYGNLTASYGLADALTLRLRTGLDYHDQTTEMRKAFSSVTAPNGYYQEGNTFFQEWNSDVLLTYERALSENWSVEVSAGGSHMRRRQEWLNVEAPELSVPGVYNIGNSRTNTETYQYRQEKEVNAVYGLGQIGFRDMVYLDLTARNDWSSTLPTDNNAYFYPSVSLSAVLTDLLGVPVASPLSFAKLRLSWAQAGNDTEPYQLRNTYGYGEAWGSTQTVFVPPVIRNADLKPEITTAYEAGVDAQFFQSRLGLDATYYRSSSRNQILQVPLASATGYTSRVLNAGEIINRGVEVSLNATPIADWAGFGWDVGLNWTRNRSEVAALAEGIDTYVIANPYGGTVEARVGGRMGDMYGRVFRRVENESSPYFGEIIYENGLPQLTNEVRRIGNYNHDWTGGLSSTFSYRGLTLGALLDVRWGGRLYSYTHATGIEGGTLEGTTAHRGEEVTGEGVVQNADGSFSPNETPAQYVTWLRAYYARSNIESNSFDATYAKLREARLGYRLPRRLIGGLARSATVSLIGRNLFLWTDVPHVDPETTFKNGAQRVPGFEVVQLPSTRSFGLDLSLAF